MVAWMQRITHELHVLMGKGAQTADSYPPCLRLPSTAGLLKSQALLDSPTSACKARSGALPGTAASPQPPAAVTPMTRGVDLAHSEHEGGRDKVSPAPVSGDVSPKVRRAPCMVSSQPMRSSVGAKQENPNCSTHHAYLHCKHRRLQSRNCCPPSNGAGESASWLTTCRRC